MNQIIMWIMAVGAVLGGVDRIAGNRFGLGKRFEEGFTLLGPTALSMSGIICLTPLLSRFLRFALVPIWNFLGLDAGLLAGILAIDMGGYQLAGELSASQEMVRYAGLVIAATLGCTITFTIPVGMGMLKSGDRLFFSRGMLIGTGTLPVTMIVGGLLSGLSFLQIVLQSLPVLLFCCLLYTSFLYVLRHIVQHRVQTYDDRCICFFNVCNQFVNHLLTLPLLSFLIEITQLRIQSCRRIR